MASVNDYGGPTDFLASIPFGGIGGWAEAVAAALDNRDEPTDQRIAALEAQVLKLSGGTMTGPITLPDASPAASEAYADGKSAGGAWSGPADTDVIVTTVDHGLGTADIGVSVTGLAAGAGEEAKYLYVLYDVNAEWFRVQAFITATGERITAGTQASFSWTAVKA